MSEHPLVYLYSYGEAHARGEYMEWGESFHENVECARKIEQAIRDHFNEDGDIPGAAQPVIDRFGFKRTLRVLTNTVERSPLSRPISEENRAWIGRTRVPDDLDFRRYYEVDTADGLLDRFLTQTREAYQTLGLFEPEHCSKETNYEGKVLVLSPETLKDAYWSPEDQLWYAHDGFGCSPAAIGRSIRCTCLGDGDESRWDRADFIGVLKDEFLPEWAKPRLAELTGQDSPAPQGMEMT